MRLSLTLLACALIGCGAGDLAADSYIDEDFPPWNCDTDVTGTGTGCASTTDGSAAGDCQGSLDCGAGDVCAAAFDGEIGVFRCESTCIESMDEQRWCFDDAACCDPLSVCSRGYCLPSADATSSDTLATGESGADSSGSSTASTTSDATGESSSATDGGTSSSGGSSGG